MVADLKLLCVDKWIRYLTSDQGIVGSSPAMLKTYALFDIQIVYSFNLKSINKKPLKYKKAEERKGGFEEQDYYIHNYEIVI